MVSLRYVGAEPGSDTGVVNRKKVNDYIAAETPTLTSPREQAALRGATYPARTEVANRYATYATNSDLATESAKYFRISDVGTTLATVSNGKLTENEWPTNYRQYVEPQGTRKEEPVGAAFLNNFLDTNITTLTVNFAGPWSWLPFVSGAIEVNTGSVTTVALKIRDESNRVIAEGYSSIGTRSMVAFGAKNTPAYSGSQTFRLQGRIVAGSDVGEVTGWSGRVMIVPVPA